MKKRLLLTSLCLGIAFDILFWKKAPGISFAIFTALCLAAGILLLRAENLHPARKNLLLFIPIIFFCGMTFMRLDPLTLFLNHAITLFSMAVLAMTTMSGLWTRYSMCDYAANMLHLIGSMLTFPLLKTSNTTTQQETSNGKSQKTNVWPIIRGVLLAIPVLLVFAALFSSADLIFSQQLDILMANLKLEKLPEYIFRGITIFIIANFLVGIFNHAANRSQNIKLIEFDKKFLGFTEASIILGSVLLLFSAFVTIQFRYFFFGQTNITLTGFTYSEYARRGFGELVAAAFFSLILLLSLSAVTKRETNRQKKSFSGLVIGLVLLVIIILVSAFQRLSLYEAAYGFSRLRTYAHVFMIWLGILLAAVVAIEVLKQQRAFANIALLVLMGFTASLNILNVDAFIAQQNINKAVLDQELDISYLSTLSDDAVPTLVKAFSSTQLPSIIRDGVGAALVCIEEYEETDASQTQDWQSFHFSHWKADRALDEVQEGLKGYQVQDNAWPIIILSPNGTEYPCYDTYFYD